MHIYCVKCTYCIYVQYDFAGKDEPGVRSARIANKMIVVCPSACPYVHL